MHQLLSIRVKLPCQQFCSIGREGERRAPCILTIAGSPSVVPLILCFLLNPLARMVACKIHNFTTLLTSVALGIVFFP